MQFVFGPLTALKSLVVAARPYALLDTVLTPAEILNNVRHDATLAILKKAVGRDHIMGLLGAATRTLSLPKPRMSASRGPE